MKNYKSLQDALPVLILEENKYFVWFVRSQKMIKYLVGDIINELNAYQKKEVKWVDCRSGYIGFNSGSFLVVVSANTPRDYKHQKFNGTVCEIPKKALMVRPDLKEG